MAFTPISDQALGEFLQVAYINTVRDQLSGDIRDFEMLKMTRDSDPLGRQTNFLLRVGRGPAANQYSNPGSVSSFPKGQLNRQNEYTALYKDIYSTVQFPLKLWQQLKNSPSHRYADAFAEEVVSKALESKRMLGRDMHGDGTGVLLTTASVAEGTIAADGQITITANTTSTARGFVGWCIEDDILIAADPDSTLRTPTGAATFYGWKVLEKDRAANTVTLQAVDTNYGDITATASNIVAGDYLYRVGQPTIPDLSGAVADYGSVTEVIPGLEALAARDANVTVHGITMSGTTGATVEASGGTLDFSKIETVLNEAKIRVGESAYAYPNMLMAPEAHSFFININETDRRLNTVDDQVRGGKKFVYQHRTDSVETMSSEFARKDRIWFVPESKAGQGKVLEGHLTDFQAVKPNDMSEFRMSVVNGSYVDQMESNMHCSGTLLSRHPAAIASIRGFTLV